MFPFAKIGKTYVVSCAMISAMAILIIIAFLLAHSYQAFMHSGWQLLTTQWNPPKNQYGILPMIYGSLAVTIIALTIALPLGITHRRLHL